MAAAGAVIAWAGATLLVIAEGRRALAAGVAIAGAGLALAVSERPLPAVALLAGGLLAGALRLRGGPPGWQALPPGSTPRLVLAIVAGILGAFVAVSVVPSPDPAAGRAAIVVAGCLAAARVLSTARRGAALASLSTLCLVMAALEILLGPALAGAGIAAAAAAALIGLLPGEPEGAADGA